MVREWCVLYILTSKCASRHHGVQFFISHLASWLRTRRFSKPTSRPSGARNHWKNRVFRDFPTFSRICIFFLLTLSLLLFFLLIFLFSLPLPCSAFHLSILSEVWLLNFLRPEGIFHHTTHRSDQTCVHRAISCETSTLLQKSCGKQCPVHPLTPSTARAYKARLGNFGWLIESTQVSMDKSGFRIISAVPGNCTCFTCFGGVAQVSLVICGYFWCLVVASCQPYWSHGHALPRLGRSRGYNML